MTKDEALNDLVRRAGKLNLWVGNAERPAFETIMDETGKAGLEELKRVLGGALFLVGDPTPRRGRPNTWVMFGVQAVELAKILYPRLLDSENFEARRRGRYTKLLSEIPMEHLYGHSVAKLQEARRRHEEIKRANNQHL